MAQPQQQSSAKSVSQPLQAIIALLQKKRPVEAEAQARRLRKTLPGNTQLMGLHGDALRQLERFGEARLAYQQAHDAGLRSIELLLNLATCCNQDQQPEQALKLAERVLKEQAEHAAALGVRADALKRLKRPTEALADYRKAIALNPRHAPLYVSLSELEPVQAGSPLFELLSRRLDEPGLTPQARAKTLAALGKAHMDLDQDEQAFDYYRQANRIMDESLPAIHDQLERRLGLTRATYTPELFSALSPHGLRTRPQILIAGMSRSGKSLVESLFHGVAGVTLAGEELILRDYQKDLLTLSNHDISQWLATLTPDAVRRDAQEYARRLNAHDAIKITTVPGDLWSLGLIGLWAPKVPIIFCVRDVLDLGVTGFFQQYQFPEGYRYSYDLHAMGRQIAIYEKIMEHWTQVLPNPIHLVEYEALTQDPEATMRQLLGMLSLERTRDYTEVIQANRVLADSLGPVTSFDAPMPVTRRFVGIGARFRDHLVPMIEGYKKVVEQFPRIDPPTAIPVDVPDTVRDSDVEDMQPSASVAFDWQFNGQITAIDHGAQLASDPALMTRLIDSGGLGLVLFDPAGGAKLAEPLRQHEKVQHVVQAALGSGTPGTLHASMDPAFNATLTPLPADQQGFRRHATQLLASIPMATHALDAIAGLERLDWLILDGRHDNITILNHGRTLLKRTLLIQVGVLFQAVYQHQSSLVEIMHWAARHGFVFHRLIDARHAQAMPPCEGLARQPAGSQLLEAAALLIPGPERMAALPDEDRLKLAFLLDTVYQTYDLCFDLLRRIGPALGENYLKARGFYDRRAGGPSPTQLNAVRAALEAGQPSQPRSRLAEWLKKYPGDVQILRLHAELTSWLSNGSQAVRIAHQTIAQEPDDLALWRSGVRIQLRGGMWWGAAATCEKLRKHTDACPGIAILDAEAVAAHPSPDPAIAARALQALDTVGDDPAAEPDPTLPPLAQRHSIRARLLMHTGNSEAAWLAHEQALAQLADTQGPQRAEALISFADSLYAAQQFERACDRLWEACDTHPYSPATVRAYRKLVYWLGLCRDPGYQRLADLHREFAKIWTGYKEEKLKFPFGDFELPYQGFEPLRLPGSRPAMHRLGIYNLQRYLPSGASALDIGCNHGFLLIGLADHLSSGLGFDISQSCIEIGNLVASHLGHTHIQLSSQPFDQFRCKKPFDLVIACAVHHWIGIPLPEFGAKLHRYCKTGGIVLLESQGIRLTDRTEIDFEAKAAVIAEAGFEVIDRGSLCDDGINFREFQILRKIRKPSPAPICHT